MYANDTNAVTDHSSSSLTSSYLEGCQSDILILIMKIQAILLIVFGFFANLCSFVVLMQPRLRRRPTFSYLAFLSLSNALLSLIHAFFTSLGVYFGLTLENLSLFIFCRLLNRFAIDFLTHFSLFTLTAVDIDRVRSVTSNTSEHQRYSQGNYLQQYSCGKAFIRVCLIELSFACFLFCLDLHWLTSYGYTTPSTSFENSTDFTMCTVSDTQGYSLSYGIYLTSILPIIELVLFGILPFSISLVATVIILRHVSLKYTFVSPHNKHLKQSRRRMELHVSILLISLNCVFILFTTPHNIYNVYVGHLRNKLNNKDESDGEFCHIAFTQKSLDLLQQCYFMSTFFLYILTNKRFREEFYRLFLCFVFIFCRHKNTNNNSQIELTIHQHRNVDRGLNHNNLLAPAHRILVSRTSLSDASQDDEPVLPLND